ncbi:MAG: hypothetical protein ABI361_10710 [Nitrososphaera sp.]|jgi:hypothetical protein
MAHTISLDDQTFKRLTSIVRDLSSEKKADVDYVHAINILIDAYLDSLAFTGENAGG